MKTLITLLLLAFLIVIEANAQSVTLSPNGAWVPSMTSTVRTSLSATIGQLVYDTTTSSFWFYNGSAWKEITSSAATNWSITGNSGTSSSTNFIGTTDNIPLNFRMKNVVSGKIDSASYNTSFGFGAAKSISTGKSNTILGYKSGTNLTTGGNNVAIGSSSLSTNTIGNFNVAIGDSAMTKSTIGLANTAIGYSSLKNATIAAFNSAFGYSSLENNTMGGFNSAFGYRALNKNTVGGINSAFGMEAMYSSTEGLANSAFGYSALYSQTTASNNTAIGGQSLYGITTGGNNTALGYRAGWTNSSGTGNVFLGSLAGASELGSNKLYISNSDTSTPLIYGDFSTKKLMINDSLQSKYFRMTNGAANDYILQSDAKGNASWVAPTSLTISGDNLGSHTATQNVNLGSNYLSNDGSSKGLQMFSRGANLIGDGTSAILEIGNSSHIYSGLTFQNTNKYYQHNVFNNKYVIHEDNIDIDPFVIDDPTSDDVFYLKNDKIGIGTSSPSEKFEVSGKTKTTNFQMTNGAINGYVLQSDANGNGSWVNVTNIFGTNNITSNYLPKWNGSSFNNSILYEDGLRIAIGKTGIGTGPQTTTSIELNNENGDTGDIQQRTAGGDWPAIVWARQNGTLSTPEAVPGNGETIGRLKGFYYNAENNYGFSSSFEMQTDSTNTSGFPGQLVFKTTAFGESNPIERLVIKSTGNVGIGTLTPSEKLEVSGKTKTANFQMTNGAANGYLLQSDASGNASWVASSNSWTSNGTNQYSALSGNIGIGTPSPSSKLDIQNNSQVAANIQSSGSHAYLFTSAPSGFESAINFKTYSSGSSSNRWAIGKSVGTETGSQAGSDFFINSYNDAGSYLSTPLYITRSTGTVNINSLSATTQNSTTLTATTANVSALSVTGSMTLSTTTKTASYSMTSSDYCVIFTGSTASQTLTLPSSPLTGRVILIVNHSSAALGTSPSYTIGNGSTSTSITAGASVQLIYDGSIWRKLN